MKNQKNSKQTAETRNRMLWVYDRLNDATDAKSLDQIINEIAVARGSF